MLKYLKMLFSWGEVAHEPKGHYCLPETENTTPMPPVWPPSNQYQKLIEELAYNLAEKDGFQKEALHYWVEAEKQINKKYEETTRITHK